MVEGMIAGVSSLHAVTGAAVAGSSVVATQFLRLLAGECFGVVDIRFAEAMQAGQVFQGWDSQLDD
jgi:hypothetical protein